MAKRRTALSIYRPPMHSAPRPTIVVVGKGGGKRRRARRGSARGRTRARRGRAIRSGVAPLTGLALGAAVVGYAQSSGWLDSLPALGGSKTLAMGVAGYIATRMTHNKYIREAGAAAVAVAAFEFGREHGGSGGGGHASTHGWGGIGSSGGGTGPFGGA